MTAGLDTQVTDRISASFLDGWEGEYSMICFQCGHQVAESAPSCTNCGQVFGEARKIVRTVTSFQALELRKTRLESMQRELLLATEDVIDGRFEIDSLRLRQFIRNFMRRVVREPNFWKSLTLPVVTVQRTFSDRV